jgi:hypothetical protein
MMTMTMMNIISIMRRGFAFHTSYVAFRLATVVFESSISQRGQFHGVYVQSKRKHERVEVTEQAFTSSR